MYLIKLINYDLGGRYLSKKFGTIDEASAQAVMWKEKNKMYPEKGYTMGADSRGLYYGGDNLPWEILIEKVAD